MKDTKSGSFENCPSLKSLFEEKKKEKKVSPSDSDIYACLLAQVKTTEE